MKKLLIAIITALVTFIALSVMAQEPLETLYQSWDKSNITLDEHVSKQLNPYARGPFVVPAETRHSEVHVDRVTPDFTIVTGDGFLGVGIRTEFPIGGDWPEDFGSLNQVTYGSCMIHSMSYYTYKWKPER